MPTRTHKCLQEMPTRVHKRLQIVVEGKLNNSICVAAKPRPMPYHIADQGGLGMLVTPKGGKLWRWKYRFEGKEKEMSFGKYPDVSLDQARVLHAEARALLALGVDPMVRRKEQKNLARASIVAKMRLLPSSEQMRFHKLYASEHERLQKLYADEQKRLKDLFTSKTERLTTNAFNELIRHLLALGVDQGIIQTEIGRRQKL